MKILILSDGRMGHLNQSIAFAKHLDAEYEIVPVHFRYKACKLLSYVLDKCKIYTSKLFTLSTTIQSKHFDLIVCAGSRTYYAAKTLSKRLKLQSVTMMLPQSYRYDFDVIFAQSHDHPPMQTNIITLPANFSYVEPKGLFTPKNKSIGVIIGGNNAHFTMDKERIKHQLDSVFETYKGYEIAITTSPRTPKEIEELIESYPFAYSVIFSKNKINPIADFLHHCEVVFITIDSTSMISEAISYGSSCIEILPLSENKNNKFFTLAQNLENEGYVHLFDGSLGHKNKKIDFKQYAQKALA
ncbi:MAG: ELM1/GtrOC1 family putative glycosyltransferase [Sulfurospirillum sp.]